MFHSSFFNSEHKQLNLTGVLILVMGLIAASFVYQEPGNGYPTDHGATIQISDGDAYGIAAGDSKQSISDAENVTGQVGVIFQKFYLWFAGLCRGQKLAYTLVVLSLSCSFFCFWKARIR
jgi:hypothetical protein